MLMSSALRAGVGDAGSHTAPLRALLDAART